MTEKPRLFLVSPADCPAPQLLRCVQAAAQAGDVASLIIHPEQISISADIQALGIAVLLSELKSDITSAKLDGVHLQATADTIKQARLELGPNMIIGAQCGVSRDQAMQAGEQGADYIAFTQKSQITGEPLLAWWHDLFELPAVAYDPVTPEELAIILPQQPAFIRPDDAMWHSPEQAQQLVAALMRN